MQQVEVKSLHNKGDRVSEGLESLPSLLRFEPKSRRGYRSWLRREASTMRIGSALPERTPYQLQYLALFDFDFPDWKDIPEVPNSDSRRGTPSKVMGGVDTSALLYGKMSSCTLLPLYGSLRRTTTRALRSIGTVMTPMSSIFLISKLRLWTGKIRVSKNESSQVNGLT